MENAHAREVDEVLAHFGVDLKKGLSASQVARARELHGWNELPPEKGTPGWKLVLKQFDDYLVKILIVAAVVDFVIALVNGETGVSAFVEPAVIFLILIANATVGVITETNAEKAIEELKTYEADNAFVQPDDASVQADNASVLRDGVVTPVPARELVPGDVVEVSVGAKVPADLRLAQLLSTTLRVDQSILTGESTSVEKFLEATLHPKAVYQDKTCLLFSGTVVSAGRGRAVVIGTGGGTAIGKIRDAMAESIEEMTPLKQKLDEFGNLLSKVIAVICVLVWVINIGRFSDPMHGNWIQGAIYYFKIAVALAVAAIPEGLPAVVTTCLALGTRKMARQNAIVRSLPSVETLGCTTVICSDKTGTLTTNQMSVARLALLRSVNAGLTEFTVTGSSFAPEGDFLDPQGSVISGPADSPCLQSMASCAALCNDSTLSYNPAKDVYERVGEATEVALRVLVEKIGLPGPAGRPSALEYLPKPRRASYCNLHWQDEYEKVTTLEFSRDRKMMSALCQRPSSRPVLFVKGAPEAVLNQCTHVLADDGSGATQLSESVRQEFLACVASFGGKSSLRCLALAFRQMPMGSAKVTYEDESGLTLLGVLGMHDPPRQEVRSAVECCRMAGIRLIVVTGDNKATAESVCRQIGALGELDGGFSSLTGMEFDDLDPHEQANAVGQLAVLSRVEPAHKTRLVELLKGQGHVVAMTGDGVNDAPALKRADIGIAMGSGTAVARHAADMVLADDNFATIVSAVAEGRAIFANTKQFIRYMVSSNIGEVVAIFFAALLGMPEVLSPVQLLWVNLVTDGLPATALGFNPPDKEIMTSRPRRMEDGIVNAWLFVRYLVVGLYVGCATVGGFGWWYLSFSDGPRLSWGQLVNSQKCSQDCEVFANRSPSTVAMTVLVVVEMFNALNALSENDSLAHLSPLANPWLLGAIALSMVLHCFILYVPWAALLFSVTPLGAKEWMAVLWLSAPVVVLDEILKLMTRHNIGRGFRAPKWIGNAWMGVAEKLPGPLRRWALSSELLPSHRSGPVSEDDEVEEQIELLNRNSAGSPILSSASLESDEVPQRRNGLGSQRASIENLANAV